MASTDVTCVGDVLATVDKDNEVLNVLFNKCDEMNPTGKRDASHSKEDLSEEGSADDIFAITKATDASKSDDADLNAESGTESDDCPVNPISQKSSTLLRVTDLTVATGEEDAVGKVSTVSSFDLLRLGTALSEPSDTSLISKPTVIAEENKVKKSPPILQPITVTKTAAQTITSIKKRSLLNELEVATNAELQEELALIRANHLPRRNWLDELVHWRDPLWSAGVFGVLFTLLTATTVYSLVSVVGYAGLVLLLFGTVLRIFSSASQRSANLQRKSLVELSAAFREENIRRILDLAANHVHPWALRLRRLLLVESVSDSLQFAGALYSLTYVGAIFDGLTLLLLGVLSAFTLPLLYDRHKEWIDAHAATFHAAWDHLLSEARSTAMSPLGKRE